MKPGQLRRLQRAIEWQPEGELFIVIMGNAVEPLVVSGVNDWPARRLLDASSVTAGLQAIESPVQIDLRAEELNARTSRAWNQQRQQFRRSGPIVLVVTPGQAQTLSRHAPDLWKWAAIIDSSEMKPLEEWHPMAARGRIESDAYAPPVDTNAVIGPTGSFELRPEES
jgi:hypothetical protein